jgi:uncharacterized phiE125 gp8 family phage protein
MPIQRTAQPAIEPITLAEAKLHLRVDHSEEDALVSALIAAARTDAENRLQCTLITSGWTLTLDGFGSLQTLPMAPILAVASVAYVDAAGTTQTLPGAAYRLDAPAALLQPVDAWPATQADRSNAVTITYTAGYGPAAADVPAPIRQWLLLAIGDMYANRERSAERPKVPQGFADSLLDPYRIWSL